MTTVQVIIDGIDRLSPAAIAAGKALGTLKSQVDATTHALTKEEAEIQTASRGLAAHAEAVEHTSSSLSNLGGVASGVLAGIGMAAVNVGLNAVSAGFHAVSESVIGTNAQLQDSATSWGVLLGSTDAAQKKLDDLSKFAAVTPFDFPEVDHAAKLLDTFGGAALDTTKTLTLVGDVASGVNQPFSDVAMWTGRMYDAIQSGKPFGEAAARLQEMGAMSGQTRTQLEEMQKNGTDGAKIWDTFTTSMGRFGGMMQKQSQNWSGLTSTFADSINLLAAQAGKPIFDELSKDLGHVNELLASPATQQAAKHFAEFAAGGVKQSIDGLTSLVTVGEHAAHVLNDNLHPAIVAVGGATLAYGATQLPALIESTTILIPKLYEQATAMAASVGPLALVAGGIFYAIKAEDEYLAQARVVVEAQDKHNESLQAGEAALLRYASSTTTQSAAADDLATSVRDLTKAHDDAATTLQRWDTADAQTRRSMHLTNDEVAALRGQVKDFDGQILTAAGSLDMMTRAATQVEWDKANPPKGVWSAYQGEVQGATVALDALHTVMLPTGKELDDINKSLDDAAKGGLSAFSGMLDTTAKAFDGIADLTTTHWEKVAGIDQELGGKLTAARRTALEQQRADELASYQEALANQLAAEGDQLAAEKQHLGEMLITEATALAQKNGVSQDRLNEMVAGISKAYGVLPDLATTAYGQMTGSMENWATHSDVTSGSVIGDLTKTSETTIATRTEMEKMAKEYKATLVQNFKDGKIDADAFVAAEALIPARVESQIETNAAIAAAEVSKVHDQLDLIDRHPVIHFTVTSDGVPQSTGSGYSGQAPKPVPRRSGGVAGSVHSQALGGVDVFSMAADGASLHTSVDTWAADADYVLKKIDAMAQAYTDDGLKHAAVWADAEGRIAGAISTSVDAFSKINSYKGVMPNLLDWLAADTVTVVNKMIDVSSHLDKDGVAAAAVFSEAEGKIAAPIAATIDNFGKINSYQGVMPAMLDWLGADTRLVVEKMIDISANLDKDGVAAAATFAESEGKIAGALKTTVEGFNAIADYHGVMPQQIDLLLTDSQQVADVLVTMNSLAAVTAVNALNWKELISTTVGRIRQGAAAVSSLDGLNIDATVTLGIHERTKTDGTNTTGLGSPGGLFGTPKPRAMGGPVTAGELYIVGEQRPEMFVPQQSGYIVPSVPAGRGSDPARVEHHWHLTINTTAQVENVEQDFRLMEVMAGR